MLESNGKKIYPLANENGNIQGTIEITPSLIDGTSRVELRMVGHINKNNETAVTKQIEHFVKLFFL